MAGLHKWLIILEPAQYKFIFILCTMISKWWVTGLWLH